MLGTGSPSDVVNSTSSTSPHRKRQRRRVHNAAYFLRSADRHSDSPDDGQDHGYQEREARQRDHDGTCPLIATPGNSRQEQQAKRRAADSSWIPPRVILARPPRPSFELPAPPRRTPRPLADRSLRLVAQSSHSVSVELSVRAPSSSSLLRQQPGDMWAEFG